MWRGESCIAVVLYDELFVFLLLAVFYLIRLCNLHISILLIKVVDYDVFLVVSFCRTGMAGVPGTASAIFGAVKDVRANVIMISQVHSSSFALFLLVSTIIYMNLLW